MYLRRGWLVGLLGFSCDPISCSSPNHHLPGGGHRRSFGALDLRVWLGLDGSCLWGMLPAGDESGKGIAAQFFQSLCNVVDVTVRQDTTKPFLTCFSEQLIWS
jgi:hypothetical protein